MADEMLTELYRRAFEAKAQAEAYKDGTENADRKRSIAIAKNGLLIELIDIRTEQLRRT